MEVTPRRREPRVSVEERMARVVQQILSGNLTLEAATIQISTFFPEYDEAIIYETIAMMGICFNLMRHHGSYFMFNRNPLEDLKISPGLLWLRWSYQRQVTKTEQHVWSFFLCSRLHYIVPTSLQRYVFTIPFFIKNYL